MELRQKALRAHLTEDRWAKTVFTHSQSVGRANLEIEPRSEDVCIYSTVYRMSGSPISYEGLNVPFLRARRLWHHILAVPAHQLVGHRIRVHRYHYQRLREGGSIRKKEARNARKEGDVHMYLPVPYISSAFIRR